MRTILLLILLLLGVFSFDRFHGVSWAIGPQEQEATNSLPQDEKKLPAIPEMGEMEMMERVEELRIQLGAQKIPDRDAAEQELKNLGPAILDFLEIPEDDVSSDTKERLVRIRLALEKLAAESVTKPSTVTLQGTLTLGDALAAIKRLTKNDVALMDQAPDEFLNQQVVLNLQDAEFWSALDNIMKQANLTVAPYSGDRGQLRLAPLQMVEGGANNEPAPVKKIEVPLDYAGIFAIRATRTEASRNLMSPANSHCNIHLLVRWEPRIQPISLVMAMKEVQIVDEFDQKIPVANDQSVVSGIVQPQIPELEFTIPIKLVDRQIEVINSFTATIDAVLPGRIETFKFKNLGNLAAGAEQSKAGVIVSYGGSRKNDDIWTVLVNVGFDDANEATESYQGWIYENEVYLLDENDNRQDYIGYESFTSEESRIGVQYLFDIDPAKCTLVYKTPAAIVKTPIVFKLEKIPLP